MSRNSNICRHLYVGSQKANEKNWCEFLSAQIQIISFDTLWMSYVIPPNGMVFLHPSKALSLKLLSAKHALSRVLQAFALYNEISKCNFYSYVLHFYFLRHFCT